MLRVAIIGISGYGAYLAEILRKFNARGRIRFAAATVINRAEELQRCQVLEREGVCIYESYPAMLADRDARIDLCIIPVGIPWHASIAIDALRAGCHVLLEKPIAGSYADAVRICRIARQEKKRLFVGFQDISDQGVWDIKEALLGGLLGEVKEIRAAGAWPRPVEYYRRNAWAGKLVFDGIPVRDSPMNNALAHLVNLAFFWAGQTRTESGSPKAAGGFLYRFLSIESFDTGWIQWDLGAGLRVVCAASHATECLVPPRISIQGSRGNLLWDYEQGLLESPAALKAPVRPSQETLRDLSLDSVIQSLQGVPSFHCSGENALAHARAIDLAHTSLPIQCNHTAEVQVDYREDGEYHFVRGLEKWCSSALQPGIVPQPVGVCLNKPGKLQSSVS
jgi:predicted dehydrogenase